jgi:hypothetical protein
MRFRLSAVRGLVLGLALLAAAPPAIAQDGVLDATGMSVYALEETVMQAARETVSSDRRKAARVAPAPSRLAYTPSMERRRANLASFVAKSRKVDPRGAATLEKELAATDVIGRMNRALAAYGMRADNAADAYAAWWLNAWLASRQRSDDPTARQVVAVRAQAAEALMATPALAGAGDAVKQEMAEAHLVQAALISAHMEGARGDPALSRRVAAAVRQGALASGLDLAAMELTDDGFVPRR